MWYKIRNIESFVTETSNKQTKIKFSFRESRKKGHKKLGCEILTLFPVPGTTWRRQSWWPCAGSQSWRTLPSALPRGIPGGWAQRRSPSRRYLDRMKKRRSVKCTTFSAASIWPTSGVALEFFKPHATWLVRPISRSHNQILQRETSRTYQYIVSKIPVLAKQMTQLLQLQYTSPTWSACDLLVGCWFFFVKIRYESGNTTGYKICCIKGSTSLLFLCATKRQQSLLMACIKTINIMKHRTPCEGSSCGDRWKW